jgi:1-acyl-sn-glycerol-3-phosphate acyltransferase
VSAIEQGQAVIVFPEGTSTDGDDLAPFHANIFESAVRSASQVQMLTLRYRDKTSGALARGVHFTGTMSLIESLRTITKLPTTQAVVHIGERVPAAGHTRKSLSEHTHATMRAQLLATRRL